MRPLHRDPEALLSHDDFVRAVARRLLADEHRVDDVVQQTWLAAWMRAPGEPRSLRAWLATVARNFARDARRGDARRADRERAASRPEAVPPVERLLEREAARRRVGDAVAALEEPYRSTLLLRFLDALPPPATARRAGVPVETVKTRLKRGLDLVRARLDAQHGGDRRTWALALAPIAALPAASGAGAAAAHALERAWEAAAMTTKAKLGWVALALVGATALWVGIDGALGGASGDAESRLARNEPATSPGPSDRASAPLAAAADPDAERAARELDASRPATRAASAAPTGSLRVTAIWARDKTPAAGVGLRVQCFSAPENAWDWLLATTDASGVALFPRVPAGQVFVQLDRGGANVMELAA